MIGYLKGILTFKDPTYVLLEVNNIGYEVKISLNTYGLIKNLDTCKLHTYLNIKEDAHTLYGFYNPDEKQIFLKLISISGVGPGTALMITSSMTVDEIKNAIVSGDVGTIQRVKGIGNKTAQRIILELKDKVGKESPDVMVSGNVSNTIRTEALSALMTLGINKSAAEKSLDFILKKSGDDITLEDLIKQVLQRT